MFLDPMAVIGLAFLAVFGGTVLFGSSDDDSSDAPLPEPEPGTEPGEGDDIITGFDPDAAGSDTLATLGGDDHVTLTDPAPGITVDLGDGNDTLIGGPFVGGAIYGGEGDDVIDISVTAGVTIYAGAGDDQIAVDMTGYERAGSTDRGLYIETGPGDTLIHVDGVPVGAVFIDNLDSDVVTLEISLRPDEHAQLPDDDVPVESRGYPYAAAFGQFVTGQDKIIIDPYTHAGDATFSHYEIMTALHTGHTQVVLHYTHPDYPDGLALAVASQSGTIQAGDVQIVDTLPDRSA